MNVILLVLKRYLPSTTVYCIFTLSVASFMYNYSNSLLPPSFNNLFHENNTYHNYPTRNRNQLRPPRTRTKHATNFISYQGAMIWNLLKSTFDTDTSVNVFKRNTKRYLLSTYWLYPLVTKSSHVLLHSGFLNPPTFLPLSHTPPALPPSLRHLNLPKPTSLPV